MYIILNLKMRNIIVYLLSFFCLCLAKEYYDKLDRYIIACHTTDFICFKKQFKSLRDHVLLGNEKLAIGKYEPYMFEYGDSGTCIRLSGLEESQLIAISIDSRSKEFSLTLDMPLRIQQVKTTNSNKTCAKPEVEFQNIGPYNGTHLKKFTGNATIQVTYPYELRKKKKEIHLLLDQEDVDVILDIPDLSRYDKNSEFESKLFEASEWAYSVVRHTDAAQHFALPFTDRLRSVTARIPLQRLLLLYPEEEYVDVHFAYADAIDEIEAF